MRLPSNFTKTDMSSTSFVILHTSICAYTRLSSPDGLFLCLIYSTTHHVGWPSCGFQLAINKSYTFNVISLIFFVYGNINTCIYMKYCQHRNLSNKIIFIIHWTEAILFKTTQSANYSYPENWSEICCVFITVFITVLNVLFRNDS